MMHFYRRLPTIKAMSFDLDDTLYDNHPVIIRLEQEVRAWVQNHYPKSQNMDYRQWHELKLALVKQDPNIVHDVTVWRYTQLLLGLQRCGYSEAEAKLGARQAMAQVAHWRNKVEVPEITHHVMQTLSKKMPLVAITNGNVDPAAIGIAHYFSLILRAGPDGKQKPYPDMFHSAQTHLDVPMENILHVGDHPKSDVLGAKQAGMSACWIHHNQNSMAKMRTLPDVSITHLCQLLELVR